MFKERIRLKDEMNQPLAISSFRGRIQSDYDHSPFLQAISDCRSLLDRPDTEILLESRNRVGVVKLPQKNGESVEIVIKEYQSRGINRLKSVFLPTKAFKAWRGGQALMERGIDSPFPVAYLEKKKGLFLDQSFFLAERVSGVKEIRSLFRERPSSELRKILASLAQYLSCCHDKGILHNDLSDGNILVKMDKKGEFRFYLLDTNRIKCKKRIGLLRRIKNLIRLGIPSASQSFFLEHYLGRHKVRKDLWVWYRINKWVYTFFIDLKKKLRLRQLAQKLKIQ